MRVRAAKHARVQHVRSKTSAVYVALPETRSAASMRAVAFPTTFNAATAEPAEEILVGVGAFRADRGCPAATVAAT